MFSSWYAEAQREAPIDPNIVALATATESGRPSVRMVFYRGIREGGFSFFTNYESRKGRELAANAFAAMAFYWPHLGRQVRIEGSVNRLSAKESDSYFVSRSFGSHITAVASRQSRPMLDENEFTRQLTHLEQLSAGKQTARPDEWGGLKILPSVFEFWIRGEHRRHKRILYTKEGKLWSAIRLYP